MIIGAIIVGIFIFALIGLGSHFNERYGGNFDAGVFIGIIIATVAIAAALAGVVYSRKRNASKE